MNQLHSSKYINNKYTHFSNYQIQESNNNKNINHNDRITNVTNIKIRSSNYIITPTRNNNIRKTSNNNSYIRIYLLLIINSILYDEKLNNELTKSSMLLNNN